MGTTKSDVASETKPADREWSQDETDEECCDEEDYLSAECGRWNNGSLTQHCRIAGSEWCDWNCPIGLR